MAHEKGKYLNVSLEYLSEKLNYTSYSTLKYSVFFNASLGWSMACDWTWHCAIPLLFHEIYFSVVEFRDCFSLYAREKSINSVEQLTTIMRSLGFSPTITEVQQYFAEYQKGKHITFIQQPSVNYIFLLFEYNLHFFLPKM